MPLFFVPVCLGVLVFHEKRYGNANTVSTPPWLLKLPTSANAPIAPSAAVGSSPPMSPATPIPDHPPIPDNTAIYCLPSGPVYVIGLPMMPEGVLNFHKTSPV